MFLLPKKKIEKSRKTFPFSRYFGREWKRLIGGWRSKLSGGGY